MKQRIQDEFNIPCFDPANGEVVSIANRAPVPVEVSKLLLRSTPIELGPCEVDGILVVDLSGDRRAQLLDADEVPELLGAPRHCISFSVTRAVPSSFSPPQVLKTVAKYVSGRTTHFVVRG